MVKFGFTTRPGQPGWIPSSASKMVWLSAKRAVLLKYRRRFISLSESYAREIQSKSGAFMDSGQACLLARSLAIHSAKEVVNLAEQRRPRGG
jgi:hypothetical protein